jgi:hypothetical protein
MGREQQTQPPVEPEFIRQAFMVGANSGALIRRSTGESACYKDRSGQLLTRVYVDGRVRRVVASRVAWCLSAGKWPRGPVLPRNGDPNDMRAENLIETRHGRDPFGAISGKHSKGGKRSALHERQASDAALLRTLAEHQGALTVPQLSQSLGQSAPCCCVRLARLERGGLVCGPHCNARRRWNLTAKGEALAAAPVPVVLDDLDKRVLQIVARSPCRLVKIVAHTGICRLTARRRVNLMVERKLIEAQGRKFSITDAGLVALGPSAPKRWINTAAISAVSARDMQARHGEAPADDRTTAQRAAHARMARGRPRGGKQALMRAMAV